MGTTPAGGFGLSATWTNAKNNSEINGKSIISGGGYGPISGGAVLGTD
ncbi:MAG: hypothetical protein ABFC94_12995 [Syntrophomonas sp.]